MSTRAATWLAWTTCALSLLLTGLSIGLLVVLNLFDPDVPVFRYWTHLTAIAVAFSTAGAIIASYRPKHPVGWLFCTIGLLVSVDHFCAEYATYALLAQPEALLAGEAAAWIRSWIWIVSGGLGVFLVLLFPNGHLPSIRWRYVAWLNVFVIVLGAIAVAFSPGPVDALAPEIRNPLGIDSLGIALGQAVVDLVEEIQIVVALSAAVSPFVRLRHAGFEERQQIKWFAYAATILILGALLSSRVPEIWEVWWVSRVGFALYIAGIVGLPVAVGIAILRHHLYDINLIINRTLVYGSLTASLVLVYLGGVAATEAAFRALTGQVKQPQLAIVVSTLVIAALFNPLRKRIQSFIDRRFYRNKYDARKTLESFSATLRDETDLEALSEDLVGVVSETMQPAHVSLWLRPKPPPGGSEGREHVS
jgi:hypothetical protein